MSARWDLYAALGELLMKRLDRDQLDRVGRQEAALYAAKIAHEAVCRAERQFDEAMAP